MSCAARLDDRVGARYLDVVGLGYAGVLVEDEVDVALGNALSHLGKSVGKLVIDVLLEGRSDLQSCKHHHR